MGLFENEVVGVMDKIEAGIFQLKKYLLIFFVTLFC